MEETEKKMQPYDDLTPERVLQAIESKGFLCDGTMLALNSYENRVYQVGIEDHAPVVAKFYRPHRWSREAILEEHAFTLELAERELPVVAPLMDEQGNTLYDYGGYLFSICPRRSGHWPELDNRENLEWMGRFLAQIHSVGALRRFAYRQQISIDRMGRESIDYLQNQGFIPAHLEEAYSSVTNDLLRLVEERFEIAGPVQQLRIHGDCHPGNILWTPDGPHFVDFDDTVTGPAIQDLWMLLSGDQEEMSYQVSNILDGYSMFREFDLAELVLIEALRTLRMLHYSAWLAKRWNDPAFPHNFPWFNTTRYWEDQVLQLREQISVLQESSLTVR
jgi:Ser/Thr protein kinase RdoA (MazF antagonist)